MRSDVRALLGVFGAAALVAVIIMGVIAAGAFGILPTKTAIYAALAVFVVGALVIGRRFARALVRSQLESGNFPASGPEPDRGDGPERTD
jgi:hypothetical protein